MLLIVVNKTGLLLTTDPVNCGFHCSVSMLFTGVRMIGLLLTIEPVKEVEPVTSIMLLVPE